MGDDPELIEDDNLVMHVRVEHIIPRLPPGASNTFELFFVADAAPVETTMKIRLCQQDGYGDYPFSFVLDHDERILEEQPARRETLEQTQRQGAGHFFPPDYTPVVDRVQLVARDS